MGKAYDHLSGKMGLIRGLRKVPAIMAAIVRHHGDFGLGALSGVRKYGLAENAAGSKIMEADAFPVGSVSKPISGYMLAMMLKVTRFDWKTTIGDVFTELKSEACRRHFNIRDDFLRASIRQMMTHTAGFRYAPTFGTHASLVNLVGNFDEEQRAEYCSREALMRRRYNYVIASQQDAPGPSGVYNGGPILPTAMMERVTGKSYEELIEEYVFDPLDMKRAGVGRTFTKADPPDGVWWHAYDFNTREPVPNEFYAKRMMNFSSHAPAGGVYLSVSDAIKFIAAQCTNNTARRPLKNEWLDETFQHHANGCSVSGWLTGHDGTHRFVTHDGSNLNDYTRMKIWPDRGEGYIVCTNVGGIGPFNNQPEFNFGHYVVNDIAAIIEDMLTNWRTKFPGE